VQHQSMVLADASAVVNNRTSSKNSLITLDMESDSPLAVNETSHLLA